MADASLNPNSASCNRKKKSPEPPSEAVRAPRDQEGDGDVAPASSRSPCRAVGAAPPCTPNLRSELVLGGPGQKRGGGCEASAWVMDPLADGQRLACGLQMAVTFASE